MTAALIHDGRRIPQYATLKAPTSTSNYVIAFGDWLEPGETIVSRAWSATGVTIDSSSYTSSAEIDGETYTAVEIVWLSGGTAKTVALVTCTVTTSKGRVEPRSFLLPIGPK